MIRVTLKSLKNGITVAIPVHDINGKSLIGRDVILNENYIQKN